PAQCAEPRDGRARDADRTSGAGGAAIDHGYGLTAPLWVGVALAILCLMSLVPERFDRSSPS
ncbi:hypothetical protein ACNJD8_21445, partial [Mycobacterium tuberculosis]